MLERITRLTVLGVAAFALGAGGTARANGTKVAAAPSAPIKTKKKAAAATGTPTVATAPDSTDITTSENIPEVKKAPIAPAPVWPLAITDRPVTLPKGVWSAGLGVSANNDFSAIGVDATGLWGLSYGITDQLSVGVAYGMAVEPSSSGKGPLAFNVGYGYYSNGPLSLTATATAGYDMASETMTSMAFGTYLWWTFIPRVTLISPGGQLSINPEDPNDISLTLPVSISYQFTPHIFASFNTNLLPNVGVKNSDTMLLGADSLPVGVSAYYSPSNQLDIGLTVSTDARNSASDNLSFGLLLLYYGGV